MSWVGFDLGSENLERWWRQAAVSSGPDAIGAAVIGKSRIGADAGSGEHDEVFRLHNAFRAELDFFLEIGV